MKLKFAEPDSTRYENAEPIERDDLTKEEVIELAMFSFGWKESKCLSWYKLQIPQLAGNSAKELVQRKETSSLVTYLKKMEVERVKNHKQNKKSSED